MILGDSSQVMASLAERVKMENVYMSAKLKTYIIGLKSILEVGLGHQAIL